MNLIIDTVNTHLPPRRKTTPSRWVSFNAVCCHHNGEKADTRQRGGIMLNEGVSYHCFNCGFKASWQPGRKISAKFKRLLKWLNVSDELITKCSIEAMRIEEVEGYTSERLDQITFIDKALPRGSEPITSYLDNVPDELVPVLAYLQSRNLYLEDYDFHWTDEEGFTNRLIIPFRYQGRIVGYTARKITEGKPKYISEQQPGYVFNLDRQLVDRKYVFVVEGPIDAISIDGVALTSAEINQTQRKLIEQLGKQIVVVPDRDQPGYRLVEQALEFGWGLSFPEWPEGVKDINEAQQQLGRLAALYLIVQGIETNQLKQQLRARAWFKGQ
jgi:hypothetical protein